MPRSAKAPLLAALACAAAITPLAVAAYGLGPVKRADLSVLLRLERGSGPVHDLASVLVNLGDLAALLVLLAVACAIGLRCGRPREALAAAAVVAGANLTTQLLKAALEHARHRAFEHGIELPWPNSFPSGHTTAAASIAVALLLVVPARRRLGAAIAGALLTAAVATSVVVLGWHYPSDVLGALLVVAAWGFAALAALCFRAGRDDAVSGTARRPDRTWAVPTD